MRTASAWRGRHTAILGALTLMMAASQAWGACAGGACSAPGAGPLQTDCVVEYDGVTLNNPATRPRNVVCTDGDPACDADATPNGTCRFDLTICLNNPDPRFPACVPSDVASFVVRNRAPSSPKFDTRLAAIEASVNTLGLPNAGNVCTAVQQFKVDLVVRDGTYRPGKNKIRSKALTSGGAKDADRIKFQCMPSAAAPAPGATFARAEVIAQPASLIGGALSRGRLGDLRIFNEKIQVVIQQPGRALFGIGVYGGNIVDADRYHADGIERDNFEEWSPGINIENTANYTSVVVLNDGTDGNPAVIRATGPDDLLDFVNGSSVVAGFGFTFPPSADDRDLPIDVQTDYTLAPGAEYVKVDTTITNLGGTPLDIFFADYLNGSGQVELFQPTFGFGEPLVTTRDGVGAYVPCTANGTCDPQDFVAYSGEDGAAGVSYGYIHGFNASTSFTTSGVTVPLLGQEAVTALLGAALPNFSMTASGNAGDAVTITRYFAVGDGSVASIAEIRNQILGVTTGTIGGTITDSGGGVADADVAITGTVFGGFLGGPNRNIVNHTRTKADGTYSLTLAPGNYTIQANKGGRLAANPGPTPVTVAASSTLTQNFTVTDASAIRVHVTDENSNPIAAKVQLVGFDPSPDPRNFMNIFGLIQNNTGMFGEEFEDGMVQGIANVTFADKNGDTGDFAIEPGTYQLAVSHGGRYSAFLQNVTITAGTTTTVNAQIAKVVPTPGFIIGDFHVHGINSPDSEVTMTERVATQVAEGTDFFTPSEHDIRVDYRPTVEAMGVQNLIATAISAEITTFDYGHFNSWPVTVDPTKVNGGSVDWGRDGIAPGMDFPSLGSFNLSPQEIYAAAHADPKANLIQINHMRSHFNRDGLDIDTAEAGTGPPTSHTVGATRRLDPSITNYFDDGFDALEVWIGTDGRTGDQTHFVGENLGDWINMLNQGIVASGVADSDTHQRRTTQINARTYVASTVTDPALLWTEDENLAQSVVIGHATGTNAPFLRVSVTTPLGTAGLGAADNTMIATNDGSATVDVTVDSPVWAPFDKIEFYVNNAPQAYDHDNNVNTRKRYRVIPNATQNVVPTLVNDYPSIPGAQHYHATAQLMLSALTQDTWVIVLVRGTDNVSQPLFPVIPNSLVGKACANNPCKSCNTNADCPSSTCSVLNQTLSDVTDGNLNQCGVLALAFSNPLFIDVNQNSQYDPPGVMLTP